MEAEVDIAICLRQWDYSETSQTAALLCRRLGLVRVLGKGTRRPDPRFSGGLEIGTLGEAVIVPKNSSNLATLAGWDLRETFRASRADLTGYYAAMFAIEVAHSILPEGEPHAAVFDALSAVLSRSPDEPWQIAVTDYLWAVLGDTGYQPSTEGYIQGPCAFSPRLGTLMNTQHVKRTDSAWAVLETTAQALCQLEQESNAQGLDIEQAERVGRLLAWYVRELVERELSTLRLLFGETTPKPLSTHE